MSTKLRRAWTIKICAVLAFSAMTAIASSGQTFGTLHNFNSTDGRQPYGTLIQGTDGDLYGTTFDGGTSTICYGGCGTVFKITVTGVLTTLHSFDLAEGSGPQAALMQAADGNFYGTTLHGGANGDYGTIFKITPVGELTTLHSFSGTDGSGPQAALTQGRDGSFYGTTVDGGTSGLGTVFKLIPDGTLTTLHSFDGSDGSNPTLAESLIQVADGNFYGTTGFGGEHGGGTVFKITPQGTLTTVHSFDGADGSLPDGPLIRATDGNFYGTTFYGGRFPNCDGFLDPTCGTLFQLTPSGTLTALYSFDGATNGSYPSGGLIQGNDGYLYGTTASGIIFESTLTGALRKLYSVADVNALVQDTNGIFYGTTYNGGASGDGTVFALSVGLRPFVNATPVFGAVGTEVRILGSKLTGASSVTFNGPPAPFKVVSPTFIKTVVPPGATSGRIQVTTASGTLHSNAPFTVIP